MKNAASRVAWHRMSYEYGDGSLISEESKALIRNVYARVGNAITEGKYIIFGAGATHLLNAVVHALSSCFIFIFNPILPGKVDTLVHKTV